MFEQWLRNNFEIKTVIWEDANIEVVVITEEPYRETVLDTLIVVFGGVQEINYDNLITCVGTTGLDIVVEDWKNRGFV